MQRGGRTKGGLASRALALGTVPPASTPAPGEAGLDTVRGIGHDLANVIGSMRLLLEKLALVAEGERDDHVALLDLAGRAADLVSMLRDVTPPGDREPRCDAAGVTRTVARVLGDLGARAGVQVSLDAAPVEAGISGAELLQVLLNLGINALEAMPDGGRLGLELRARAGRVFLSVSDTGVGIEPAAVRRIFDVGFSTKPGDRGVGLSVVKQIIERRGGSLSVRSSVGGGTVFQVQLPSLAEVGR